MIVIRTIIDVLFFLIGVGVGVTIGRKLGIDSTAHALTTLVKMGKITRKDVDELANHMQKEIDLNE